MVAFDHILGYAKMNDGSEWIKDMRVRRLWCHSKLNLDWGRSDHLLGVKSIMNGNQRG
jgi:hypothetical protein